MSTKTPVIPPASITVRSAGGSAPTDEAPKSQLPQSNEVRIRRSLFVVIAVVLVAVCAVAYFIVKAITKPALAPPFALTGTLQLTGGSITTSGLPPDTPAPVTGATPTSDLARQSRWPMRLGKTCC